MHIVCFKSNEVTLEALKMILSRKQTHFSQIYFLLKSFVYWVRFRRTMAVFSTNIKGPLFRFICFPIPLPWWHKKSQRQFVTARACTRVCVHTLTPANTLVTLWHHTINSLFKMCQHRSNQKVSMLDSKLHRATNAAVGGGGCLSHYSTKSMR